MRRSVCCAAAAIAAILLAGVCQPGMAQEKSKGKTLKVKLHYTGSGTVDDKHKIIAFLFDSPDFTQGGAMPFAEKDSSSKDGIVTFADVDRSPVYVTSVYDPTGGYDGQSGPPPSGSSLGMYSTEPGQPGAVKLEDGKAAEVELTFDDSFKMP